MVVLTSVVVVVVGVHWPCPVSMDVAPFRQRVSTVRDEPGWTTVAVPPGANVPDAPDDVVNEAAVPDSEFRIVHVLDSRSEQVTVA